MKICPNCNERYGDDSLNFCLSCGSILNTEKDNIPKTAVFEKPRVTSEINWQPNNQPPAWQNQQGPQNLQNRPMNSPQLVRNPDQTLPIISLVLGILAIVICCYGGIPFGAAAIITGVIAINNEKKDPQKFRGHGMAVGGIVCGAIGVLITFGVIILAAVS